MTVFRTLACLLLLGLLAPAVAQGTQVAFGAMQQDTSAPVEVTSDELSVDQETGEAVFTGNVVIGQGDMRLSAARVVVMYRDDSAGIQSLAATGGVTLASGDDAAESQRADYDIDSGVIVMSGDVLMTQGQAALSADRMTVDLDGGTARMQGRVRTILQTGGN